jgi:uncharacterized protein
MSNIDQQFIEYVVKSLVGNPDAVQVDRRVDEKGVLLELTVDPDDLGRVIGKRGATAQSLRTLLRALGTKNDARYNLKIIDNGVGSHGRDNENPSDSQEDRSPKADTVSEKPSKEAEVTDVEPEEAPQPETKPADDDASDRLAQTRRELADLDDLDV